jgi:hypothetical protein
VEIKSIDEAAWSLDETIAQTRTEVTNVNRSAGGITSRPLYSIERACPR